eukprot:g20205.t1
MVSARCIGPRPCGPLASDAGERSASRVGGWKHVQLQSKSSWSCGGASLRMRWSTQSSPPEWPRSLRYWKIRSRSFKQLLWAA